MSGLGHLFLYPLAIFVFGKMPVQSSAYFLIGWFLLLGSLDILDILPVTLDLQILACCVGSLFMLTVSFAVRFLVWCGPSIFQAVCGTEGNSTTKHRDVGSLSYQVPGLAVEVSCVKRTRMFQHTPACGGMAALVYKIMAEWSGDIGHSLVHLPLCQVSKSWVWTQCKEFVNRGPVCR